MRVRVLGSSLSAAAVRSSLHLAGVAVSDLGYGFTVEIVDTENEHPTIDGVDCEFERKMVNRISDCANTPVLLLRPGGIRSDQHIRIGIPVGEDNSAIERGIMQAIVQAVTPPEAAPVPIQPPGTPAPKIGWWKAFRRWLAALIYATCLYGQISSPWPIIGSYTTTSLPSAGVRNRVAVVTNAASSSSCTSGGGSTVVLCRDTGLAWEPLGGGGGGGTWGSITGTLSSQTDLQTALDGKLSVGGTAVAASALASNPADCSANQYATTIAANGNLTCAQVDFSQLSGASGVVTGAGALVTTGAVPYVTAAGALTETSAFKFTPTSGAGRLLELGVDGTSVANIRAATGSTQLRLGANNYGVSLIGSDNSVHVYDPATASPYTTGYKFSVVKSGSNGTASFIDRTVSGNTNVAIGWDGTNTSGATTNLTIRAGSAQGGNRLLNIQTNSGDVEHGFALGAAYYQFAGSNIMSNQSAGNYYIANNKLFAWSSASNLNGGNLPDIGLSRVSAGVLGVGNGTAGSTSGTVQATSFVGALTGNASTASALAANGSNCTAGQFPLGVDASGAAENCTALPTTISGTSNEISASASTGAVTLSLPATVDLGGKSLEIPNSTSLPGTCTVGQVYMDTDATLGQQIYACTSTNVWTLQGDGGGVGGGISSLGGQTGATQTFSKVDDTNVTLTITSGTNNHEFALGWTGTLANSRTTATNANTASAIVARDGSGNFAAGTITAALSGNASTATALAANPADCSAGQYATTIAASGDLTCAQVAYGQVSGTPALAAVATSGSASDLSTGTLAAARGGAGTVNGVMKADGAGNVSAATAGTDYVSPSSTETLTNKTLSVEGTGNSITLVDRTYVTAAGCNNATASTAFDLPTSSAPTPVCLGTTTTSAYLGYADGSTTAATFHYRLSSTWTSTGGVDVMLLYTGSTSSTNNIRWQVSTACVGDNEALDAPSYNAASASNSAGPTTAGQRKSLQLTGLAVTNCAAGETMFVRVERVGGDGGDTYTGDGRLMGMTLVTRRTE